VNVGEGDASAILAKAVVEKVYDSIGLFAISVGLGLALRWTARRRYCHSRSMESGKTSAEGADCLAFL